LPKNDGIKITEKVNIENIPNRGINNIKNNCYAITALQCLISLPEIVDFFLKTSFDEKEQPVLTAFKKFILEYLKNSENDGFPLFISSISKCPSFSSLKVDCNRNQDSLSFLKFMIDSFKTENPDLKFKSNIFYRLFYFSNTSTFKFLCDHKYSLEIYIFLSELSLTKPGRIEEVLKSEYIYKNAPRDVSMKDGVLESCNICGSKNSKVSSIIDYLPKYLIINNIFTANKQANESIDIYNDVEQKLEINNISYTLLSLTFKTCSGGSMGHYYSICKRKNEWINFNDNVVTKVNLESQYPRITFMIYERID
jgi:ubiquitin C-terminal hydrolase